MEPLRNSIKRFFKRRKVSSSAFGTDDAGYVARDWSIALIVFVSFTIGVLAIGGESYLRVERGVPFVPNEKEARGIQSIDKRELESIVMFFEAQRKRFDELRDGRPIVPQP